MSSSTLSIRNASPNGEQGWGKFYKGTNKGDEVPVAEINRTEVPPAGSVTINACGRENTSSGTTGGFELWDGETKIANLSWDCPWSGSNYFGTSGHHHSYWIQYGSWNKDDGTLGLVTVEVGKKG